MYGQQAGHSAAFGVGASHEVARALGRDHHDVHSFRRFDHPEVDVEAVGKEQRITGLKCRGDLCLVEVAHVLVRHEHHHYVGGRGRSTGRHDLEARLGCRRAAGRPFAQPDYDRHARVVEVESVGVALAAETDDGDRLVRDEPRVGVPVVVDRSHGVLSRCRGHSGWTITAAESVVIPQHGIPWRPV